MIKVIVISDIKIYCEGLSQILSDIEPIEVIGAESNIENAISIIKQNFPQVILLDMTMIQSCKIAVKLLHICPSAKIVALAVPVEENNIIKCSEAGIAGYVAREASLDKLIETVIGANKGEFHCPPNIATYIFRKVQNLATRAKNQYMPDVLRDEASLLAGLTRRERQIVSLLVDGQSNKQISRNLTIEVSTVKNHVHNILVKLEVKSRAQAISLLQHDFYHSSVQSAGLESF
ncbi:Two-component transcriptional response regulator, LuxR family [hydrothermal vent metagenome]|uniref:Two-component transcriptional response regulator, LuxR family n=1 Tax=hydrothermal vent metagenome TaxID=652676 RepID=A0A3B0Y301_9ZZZZ